ncbi:MAG: hypothetical protein HY809_09985 [Nitrospirae bacterium]|nr:hypothetical protein [Nitrospirota bacterium]
MKIKTVISLFLLFAAPAFQTAAASQQIISIPVKEAPLLDGKGNDAAWSSAKKYTVKDNRVNVPITIKTVHTEDTLFFLVSYPDPTKDELHKPWVWDKEQVMYKLGMQREDTFVFRWNMEPKDVDLSDFSDDNFTSDLWYWKANRTNPAGYSDDKYDVLSTLKSKKSQELTSKTGKMRYLLRESDEGKECYEEVIPIDYKGDIINQFKIATPEGSRGDVKAKGEWADGVWTIEFSRKMNTGHSDDTQFDKNSGKKYLFGVSIKSLYGEPIDETQPNLYGQGRISEPLYLLFMQADK